MRKFKLPLWCHILLATAIGGGLTTAATALQQQQGHPDLKNLSASFLTGAILAVAAYLKTSPLDLAVEVEKQDGKAATSTGK